MSLDSPAAQKRCAVQHHRRRGLAQWCRRRPFALTTGKTHTALIFATRGGIRRSTVTSPLGGRPLVQAPWALEGRSVGANWKAGNIMVQRIVVCPDGAALERP